jgi:hypothetical protein
MVLIRLSSEHLKEVHKLLQDGKKIQAIKAVRLYGRKVGGKVGPRTIGLKEAKYAVDSIQSGIPNNLSKIIPGWTVNSVIVTGPCGEKIEMDIDTLQMHFLTTLSSVGLDEVAHLVSLVSYIQTWHAGQEIKSINSKEEICE